MNKREMVCICCPVGCRLTVWKDESGATQVTGFTCKRGHEYGIQEFENPMRTVTSSVFVNGGELPLCSVKTAATVAKSSIPQVLAQIRAARAAAPVHVGEVIVPNVAGSGVNVVATREVRGK